MASINLNLWTENVISLWKENNINLEKGTSISEISEVEKLIGFKFPISFVELYLKVNGFKDLDWDKNMFSVWPIKKIKEEYLFSTNKNFVGFCDYLIFSYCIGFLKHSDGIYSDFKELVLIAPTFEEGIDFLNAIQI